MRSVLAVRAGIRVNPAETEWKRPLRHIAQFLMRNVGLLHTIGQVGSEGPAGSVTFHYADGTSAAQYTVNGKHVTGWWFPELNGKLAGVAWRGQNGVNNDVGVCWAGISNPFFLPRRSGKLHFVVARIKAFVPLLLLVWPTE